MNIPIAGEYIKAQFVEQNEKGDIFALAYMDNGIFHLLVFDKEKQICDYNVNEKFNINNFTTPIAGFFQPFCMTCFSSDPDVLFYSFFHKCTMTHYHFSFNIKD